MYDLFNQRTTFTTIHCAATSVMNVPSNLLITVMVIVLMHFWHMRISVTVRLYSNIGAPEVYCNIYKIGTPAIFDYFSKRGFSTIGACATTLIR